jgi:hypothetical protein
MTTSLREQKAAARRDLHAEAAVPALYIYGAEDPVDVTVRIHDKIALTGDIPGLATVPYHDEALHLRFLASEIASPKQGAIVSVVAGEAYRLGPSDPAHGETIDVQATRLAASEANGLPVPA